MALNIDPETALAFAEGYRRGMNTAFDLAIGITDRSETRQFINCWLTERMKLDKKLPPARKADEQRRVKHLQRAILALDRREDRTILALATINLMVERPECDDRNTEAFIAGLLHAKQAIISGHLPEIEFPSLRPVHALASIRSDGW